MGDAATTTTQVSPIMMSTGSPDAEPGNGKQSPKRRSSSQRTIFGPSWPQQDLQSLEKQAVDQLKASQTANALVESALKNMKEPNGSHTAEEFQQALQTLLTYLLNIKHHPESVHFKKIGVHNPNFKWKVQSVNGAVEMLLAVGFRLNGEGDCLELHDSHMDKRMLDFLIDRLQRELTLHFQHTRFMRKKGLQGSPLRDRPVELSPSIRFPIGYADMTGRRPTMEDQIIIKGMYRGYEDEDFVGMFDGHGGKGAADLAAATLYQELWKYITLHKEKGQKLEEEDALITQVIRESFHSTNAKICQTLNLIGDFSGTTVLMSWIVGQKLVVANAGDSRAVLYKDSGKIVRLSRDHRPEDPEEKQRIEALGGRVVTLPQDAPRLNGTLSVSRGFGDFDLQPCLSPEPYINIVPISPEDRYLILGCDGLWDEVEEEKVGELFTKWRKQIKEQAQQRMEDQTRLRRMTSSSSNGRNRGLSSSASGISATNGDGGAMEAYQLARMLVDYSYTSGSYDNISVIVVQLKD
jgi:serine/threonine protein phosphatase PrpC